MSRVLVTGAAGFLGRALAGVLARERPVLLSRRPRRGFTALDLTDRAATRRLLSRLRPKVVYHLAGETESKGWDALWKAHVETTLSLLESLPRPARVVIAGSAHEYGPGRGRPLKETDPAEPESAYGVTKLCQTLAALSAAGGGLEVSVARIFHVIGPGMPAHLALGDFARQAARIERGQAGALRTGDLSIRRDFVDVRDAASALLALARRGRAGRIYNVCSGKARPLSELVGFLKEASRVPFTVGTDPARLRGSDSPVIVGSPRRIRAETGWKPRMKVGDSVRDLLDWARRL